MGGDKEQVQRVQVAIALHYQHSVQGVQAMALMGLPNPSAALVRAQVNSELRKLLYTALWDQLMLSISRMHDTKKDLDGIPSILRLLRNDAIRGEVIAPGCAHYLTSANIKWHELKKNVQYRELRNLRNWTRAHLKTQEFLAKVVGGGANLTACANETFAVIEDLFLAQGGAGRGLAWHAERWRSTGSDFWDALVQHFR